MKPAEAKALGLSFVRKLNVLPSSVGWGIALGAIFVLVLFVAWQHSNQQTRTDFEGTVVDRWGAYSESEQGSRPRFRLLVESEDGKRFPVNVDANVYESARVGMWIKNRNGQIVLIDSEQRTTGSK